VTERDSGGRGGARVEKIRIKGREGRKKIYRYEKEAEE